MESFFLLSLPFYNLSQLIFENNIDEVAAIIGETKAISFLAFSITLAMEELKNNIRGDMAEISLEMLVNVMENATERARFCLSNNGGHFIDVVFKN